jgi:hypothetical protein
VQTHNNGVRGVRSIGRVQRSLVGACTQYEYKLSRDSVVNGVCRLRVHSRGILNFGMLQCIELNV